MVRVLKSTFLLFSVALMLACSGDDSVDIDSDEFQKFVAVFAELETGFQVAGNDSSVYFPIRDSILSKFEVDTTWLNDYTATLQDDPKRWLKVWEQVVQRLQVMKDSLTP
jgi:hypothetical protein